jgi:hypothetical protein
MVFVYVYIKFIIIVLGGCVLGCLRDALCCIYLLFLHLWVGTEQEKGLHRAGEGGGSERGRRRRVRTRGERGRRAEHEHGGEGVQDDQGAGESHLQQDP